MLYNTPADLANDNNVPLKLIQAAYLYYNGQYAGDGDQESIQVVVNGETIICTGPQRLRKIDLALSAVTAYEQLRQENIHATLALSGFEELVKAFLKEDRFTELKTIRYFDAKRGNIDKGRGIIIGVEHNPNKANLAIVLDEENIVWAIYSPRGKHDECWTGIGRREEETVRHWQVGELAPE